MRRIQSYHWKWEIEPLIAIAVFIHDFLCIHPFNDGNGRISRLLTTLLLHQNGFYVGKYISLEAKIAKNKALYYESLSASKSGWHEGKEDPVPFIKYLLSTSLAAYKDFEEHVELIEPKRSALDTVRMATKNKIGRFTKFPCRTDSLARQTTSVQENMICNACLGLNRMHHLIGMSKTNRVLSYNRYGIVVLPL